VLWLRFLTEIGEKTAEAPAELLENEQTRKALSIVEKSAMTEGQLYAYEKFWDAVINEEVLIEGGYNKGMAEGEAIGLAKGEAIGIAKGEANERMRNARSLKENGIPIDVIAKSLALTDAELQQL
jgi:predicted transposase YdaD